MTDQSRRESTCDAVSPRACTFADAAAEQAVKKTFAILGVNVDAPEQVREFQESLWFGQKMRKIADQGQVALWVAFVLAIAGVIWLGIEAKIKNG